MKYRDYFPILAISAVLFLVNPSSAQMRPDCGMNPDAPGVCFSPTNEVATIICGFFQGPGVLRIFDPERHNLQFKQDLPNSQGLVHVPRTHAAFAFCKWEDVDPLTGTCPGGAFVGLGSFVLQGFESDQGYSCPLRYQGYGAVYRGDETLEINLDVHGIPDATSPGGCATRICQILVSD